MVSNKRMEMNTVYFVLAYIDITLGLFMFLQDKWIAGIILFVAVYFLSMSIKDKNEI